MRTTLFHVKSKVIHHTYTVEWSPLNITQCPADMGIMHLMRAVKLRKVINSHGLMQGDL